MTIFVPRAGSMLPGFGASLLGSEPGAGVPAARGVQLVDVRTGLHATHVPAVVGGWRGGEGVVATASADSAPATAYPVTNPTVAPRPFAVQAAANVPAVVPAVANVPAAAKAADKRLMSIAKQGARRTKGSSPWRFPA